jgi:hypothetical protein
LFPIVRAAVRLFSVKARLETEGLVIEAIEKAAKG